MSRVLPILFNTEMVRAILGGRKTVTRRLIKIPPNDMKKSNVAPGDGCFVENGKLYSEIQTKVDDSEIKEIKPPYQTGDILYVRETWFYEHHMEDITAGEPDLSSGRYSHRYVYKADNQDYPVNIGVGATGWHPSIHMPKEAARIWLKVTAVRVERLQEITEEQAVKEGIACVKYDADTGKEMSAALDWFPVLWNSTLKKSDLDRYGWDSNPWTWAIEFERCEKPESE